MRSYVSQKEGENFMLEAIVQIYFIVHNNYYVIEINNYQF